MNKPQLIYWSIATGHLVLMNIYYILHFWLERPH
jgi:hypothetical protein